MKPNARYDFDIGKNFSALIIIARYSEIYKLLRYQLKS